MNRDLVMIIANYASPIRIIFLVEALNSSLFNDILFWKLLTKQYSPRDDRPVCNTWNPDKYDYYQSAYSQIFRKLHTCKYFHVIHFLIHKLPLRRIYHITSLPSDTFLSQVLERNFETDSHALWLIAIHTRNMTFENVLRLSSHSSFRPDWFLRMIDEALDRDDPITFENTYIVAEPHYSEYKLTKGKFIRVLFQTRPKIIDFYLTGFIREFKGKECDYQTDNPFVLDFISSRDEWFLNADPKIYFLLLDFMKNCPPELKKKIDGDKIDIPLSVMRRFGDNLPFIKELFFRAKDKNQKYNMKAFLEILINHKFSETALFILSIYNIFSDEKFEEEVWSIFGFAIRYRQFSVANYIIDKEIKGSKREMEKRATAKLFINSLLRDYIDDRRVISFLVSNFPLQVDYQLLDNIFPLKQRCF